jgi:heterodisulfide reductase subunit C
MANKRQRLARKSFKAAHPSIEETKAQPADGEEQKPTNKKIKLERWKKRMEKERLREERLQAKKKAAKPVGNCWACGEDGHRSSDCPSNNRHMVRAEYYYNLLFHECGAAER